MSLDAARRAGLVGARWVLDSTPLYDAVATMDTVTLVRSAIRQLLNVVGTELEAELRGYWGATTTTPAAANRPVIGRPGCPGKALVDELAKDAYAR